MCVSGTKNLNSTSKVNSTVYAHVRTSLAAHTAFVEVVCISNNTV